MTADAPSSGGVRGSLEAANGRGIVRLEGRYDGGIDDLWLAITDPIQLARWHAQVEGDLRPGGEFRIYLASDDWEGTGRVDACEPPRRLRVTTRESEESWRKGQGVSPFDETIEAALTAGGDGTVLALEIHGIPLEAIAFYAAGWQMHAESLAVYLTGRGRAGIETRFEELVPHYKDLAAKMGWSVWPPSGGAAQRLPAEAGPAEGT